MTIELLPPSTRDLEQFAGLRSALTGLPIPMSAWVANPTEDIEVGIAFGGPDVMWYPGGVAQDPGFDRWTGEHVTRWRIQHPISGATLAVQNIADGPEGPYPAKTWEAYPDETVMLRTLWRAHVKFPA